MHVARTCAFWQAPAPFMYWWALPSAQPSWAEPGPVGAVRVVRLTQLPAACGVGEWNHCQGAAHCLHGWRSGGNNRAVLWQSCLYRQRMQPVLPSSGNPACRACAWSQYHAAANRPRGRRSGGSSAGRAASAAVITAALSANARVAPNACHTCPYIVLAVIAVNAITL